MNDDKDNNINNTRVIRKSLSLMFLRIVMFELLAGILYILLRIGLRFLDIQLDTEFSLTPLALVKSFFFMIIEIAVALIIILQWVNNYYVLSLNEVNYITGIISKKERSYSLKNIQSIYLEQGLFGRILNYGNVKIFSPALQQELFLTEVPNPKSIVDNIQNILVDNNNKSQFIMRR